MKSRIQVFLKYQYLLKNLISRDLKVKYRRSVLGILWSVLNPLLMMLVITAVFSRIFKFGIPNFHLYYLTGSLIFNFVSEATSTAMPSVIGAGNLIKKVYIPKYIFPLEKCMFSFVNALFSLVAVIIVMIFTPNISFHWSSLLFWVPMVYALIFSIGLGLLLSALVVFFRDIAHIYGVFITAWIYATPIIYPVDGLPEKLQLLMKFNPMYHFVNYFRNVVLYGVVPGVRSNLICLVFALIMLFVGVVVFKAKQDKFVLHM